jgi:hypothetical protein
MLLPVAFHAFAGKSSKCTKMRDSVRRGLEPLIQWVNFANGKDELPPNWSEYRDYGTPERCEEVRWTARKFLEGFAEYRRTLPTANFMLEVHDVPPRASVLVSSPAHIAIVDIRDWIRESFMPALNRRFGPEPRLA